jgi:hypothetical protein
VNRVGKIKFNIMRKTKSNKRKINNKYYNGRLSYEKIQFMQSLGTDDTKVIQREFKKKYGVLVREETIRTNLNKNVTKVNNLDKREYRNVNRPVITVNFNGNNYSLRGFSNKIALDIINAELTRDA